MSNVTPLQPGESADDNVGATTGEESSADLDRTPTEDTGDVAAEGDVS